MQTLFEARLSCFDLFSCIFSDLDAGVVREHTSLREQDPLTGQQRMTNIETIRSMEPTGLLTH